MCIHVGFKYNSKAEVYQAYPVVCKSAVVGQDVGVVHMYVLVFQEVDVVLYNVLFIVQLLYFNSPRITKTSGKVFVKLHFK